jgi:hypothetical protein
MATTCSTGENLPSCHNSSIVAGRDRRAARASVDADPIGRSGAEAIGSKAAFEYGASKARPLAIGPASANVARGQQVSDDPDHRAPTIQRARREPHKPARPRPK